MKTKIWLSVWIVAGWMIAASAEAQQNGYRSPTTQTPPPSGYQPIFPAPSPLNPDASPDKPAPSAGGQPGVLSDWIVYRCDACEGRYERACPLYTEIYSHFGASVPVGGMTLSRELKTGWSFVGGARALFFNEEYSAAWIVDAHVINTNESAGKQNTAFPLTITHNGTKTVFGPGGIPGATLQNSNRTMFGLGAGRDWWLWRPANFDGCTWRVGVDGGGRYGSGRVNFNELGH